MISDISSEETKSVPCSRSGCFRTSVLCIGSSPLPRAHVCDVTTIGVKATGGAPMGVAAAGGGDLYERTFKWRPGDLAVHWDL